MRVTGVEIRRSKKSQGRWWIIAVNGREIYRESTAKKARRFARGMSKIVGLGAQPLYNPEYVGIQPATPMPSVFHFLFEPEPLGT